MLQRQQVVDIHAAIRPAFDPARQVYVSHGVRTVQQFADLVENGTARYKDSQRLWPYWNYPDRTDNLVCVAVALESSLVIKSVMHHGSPEEPA
jgi:hypothetical protein